MHIKTVRTKKYKRFSELVIDDIPPVSLVVMAGPNGGGKSSLFDAFVTWHGLHGVSVGYDASYHHKTGSPIDDNRAQKVTIDFHEPMPTDREERQKIFYVRSSYRHEPDFTVANLQRMGPISEDQRVQRLIDPDVTVSNNYQRIVSASVDALYATENAARTARDLKETIIGPLRESMRRVFDDLLLIGPGDPMGQGSFFFEKGLSREFHYKNLSAGEKAAFDLLLDLHTKLQWFDNTIFCIDEPELHMHARLQGRLLAELYRLIPEGSQLWIATHSIGMLRKAQDIWRSSPQTIAFLDFEGHDFDQPVRMAPARVDRRLWLRHLGTALDDLAELVAPGVVVLCEGTSSAGTARDDFDARCYRAIFADEHPEADFVGVGNDHEVIGDQRWLRRTLESLVRGTTIVRLIDRDSRTEQEIEDQEKDGVRVLKRRHLESYLLDDGVLRVFCETTGRSEKAAEVLDAKRRAMEAAQNRGREADDMKAIAGELYGDLRKILGLQGAGSTPEAFMRDTLAPLVPKATATYEELRSVVFGASQGTRTLVPAQAAGI